MSLEHSPTRQGAARAAYTIREFCEIVPISRGQLYEEWKLGIGPRFFFIGAHRRISAEATNEYIKAKEAAAQGAA
jgi:hypothetical protein